MLYNIIFVKSSQIRMPINAFTHACRFNGVNNIPLQHFCPIHRHVYDDQAHSTAIIMINLKAYVFIVIVIKIWYSATSDMNPQKRSLLLHKKCFECLFKLFWFVV